MNTIVTQQTEQNTNAPTFTLDTPEKAKKAVDLLWDTLGVSPEDLPAYFDGIVLWIHFRKLCTVFGIVDSKQARTHHFSNKGYSHFMRKFHPNEQVGKVYPLGLNTRQNGGQAPNWVTYEGMMLMAHHARSDVARSVAAWTNSVAAEIAQTQTYRNPDGLGLVHSFESDPAAFMVEMANFAQHMTERNSRLQRHNSALLSLTKMNAIANNTLAQILRRSKDVVTVTAALDYCSFIPVGAGTFNEFLYSVNVYSKLPLKSHKGAHRPVRRLIPWFPEGPTYVDEEGNTHYSSCQVAPGGKLLIALLWYYYGKLFMAQSSAGKAIKARWYATLQNAYATHSEGKEVLFDSINSTELPRLDEVVKIAEHIMTAPNFADMTLDEILVYHATHGLAV